MEEFVKKWSQKGGDHINPTVVIAVFLMLMVLMMVMPTPAWLLDIGLAFSFASAVGIFMVVLFSERPLDFSSFPTMLLASLLLRLSLNVSSTKLIIGEGHTGTDAAGNVIEAFADFIVGGNLLLGLVVFMVIMIVNFLVITKGSGRMAEVGARFALDAMPGKQLAIDADLASGAITHEEAKARREIEQEETTFFGSLDGASKFVKGDAIAGLLITALNFFMGLAMGVIYYDMPVSEAMHTYSLLTVGDGLVTQIPAVITSIGAALLMAKGGAHGTADSAIVKQFMSYPPAIYTVAVVMAFLAMIPGLPFMPFITGAAMIAGAAWFAQNTITEAEKKKDFEEKQEVKQEMKQKEKSIGDCLDVDDIWIEFANNLITTATDSEEGIAVRIKALRKTIAADLGFILPEVRLTDNYALKDGDYVIKIQGVKVAGANIRPGWHMVIMNEGETLPCPFEGTTEPVYGAPAAWVRDIHKDKIMGLGMPVAGVNDILTTHLTETVKQNMRELVTRSSITRMVDAFTKVSNPERAEHNKKIIDEFIPDHVPKELLHQVVRLLLEERISVRNLPLILEGIAEAKIYTTDPEQVTERVRRKLSLQIATSLVDHTDNTVPLIQIGNNWEEVFREYEMRDSSGAVVDVALPPAEITNLSTAINEKLAEAGRAGRYPAVASPGDRRRLIRAVMDAKGMRHPVIAFEEIHARVTPSLIGVV